MRNSFVGLIRRHHELELEFLLPETGVARRWLFGFAAQRPAACVWAVMEGSLALEIADLLSEGEGAAALRHIMSGAESMGPLLEADEGKSQGSAS
jgi:hypothetical protein